MKKTVFITGASGEVGHGLVKSLSNSSNIVTLDINPLPKELEKNCSKSYLGNLLDSNLLEKIIKKHNPSIIFHLAATLSTSAEKEPTKAHEVNVNGTLKLLEIIQKYSSFKKQTKKFIFPSSIAAYGLPNLKIKASHKKIKENEFLNPITMYGVNKLYCENLGIYFSSYYMLLANSFKGIDFRCLRFPGLISSETLPTGGTSDYAPEMLHAAAQAKKYTCFVRPDTTIPFMAMPDAVRSLLELSKAPKNKLNSRIYNVSGFSASAKEMEKIIKANFPKAKITYKVDKRRQKIVDSWPADVDDIKASKDWGWKPKYNFSGTFNKYLIPSITRR